MRKKSPEFFLELEEIDFWVVEALEISLGFKGFP